MKDVVQTVFTAVESLAAEKRLALKVVVSPELPLGRGDERRITQVLLNLVGNAIKFTGVGEVRVDVSATDGAFRVAVSDTGPGIAPADQEKIFEEFQQVQTARMAGKPEGTGLGLAVAKRFVEMHGPALRPSHLIEVTGEVSQSDASKEVNRAISRNAARPIQEG